MCTKEVVDFTKMSHSDISKTLNLRNGTMCGRFHESQLNQNLYFTCETASDSKLTLLQKWVTASLFFGSFNILRAQNTQNQAVQIEQNMHQTTPTDTTKIERKVKSSVTISGVVWDNSVNEPIPFATIYLKNFKGCYADIDGKFVLVLEDVLPVDSIVLEVRYIGFDPLYVTVNLEKYRDSSEVVLEPMRLVLHQNLGHLKGDLHVVGGFYSVSPWKRFWYRMKFWKR